jgi:hypothetical protein
MFIVPSTSEPPNVSVTGPAQAHRLNLKHSLRRLRCNRWFGVVGITDAGVS